MIKYRPSQSQNSKGITGFCWFVGLLETFYSLFAQTLKPLYVLVQKRSPWAWSANQKDLLGAKIVVKQVEALGVLTLDVTCELDLNSYPEGFGWGLYQG